MAILRPYFAPYLTPNPAQLQPRRKQAGYSQLFQPQPSQGIISQPESAPQFEKPPIDTLNRLQEQIGIGTENARRLPTPHPVANDPIASTQSNPITNFLSTSAVRPDISGFYNQLKSIGQIGDEATAAEAARNAFRQQQLLQALGDFGNFGNTKVNLKSGAYSGTSSSGPGPSPTGGNRQANANLGRELASRNGWTGSQWDAFNRLVMKESGWNNNAQNPTSTAYGIGQFLDSTWGGYGIGKTSDPRLQIEAMIRYIKARYGNPVNALNFHLSHNWY